MPYTKCIFCGAALPTYMSSKLSNLIYLLFQGHSSHQLIAGLYVEQAQCRKMHSAQCRTHAIGKMHAALLLNGKPVVV